MKSMKVTFWGTRGSYPLHSPRHDMLGGDTSCVEIQTPSWPGKIFFDAGSGLLHTEPSQNLDIIFLSHLHIDHLLGLPYFLGNKKIAGGELRICSYGYPNDDALAEALNTVYGPPGFPVHLRTILPELEIRAIAGPQQLNQGLTLTPVPLNHPGGCVGARLDCAASEKAVVYASDHEHGTPADRNIEEACKGANLLIYDSSYDDEDFNRYVGWGHSTWQKALELGRNAKRVAITHHESSRDNATAQKIKLAIQNTTAFLAHDKLSVTL